MADVKNIRPKPNLKRRPQQGPSDSTTLSHNEFRPNIYRTAGGY